MITTQANGASELLSDGREGRIINRPNNLADLALALLELSDPEIRARITVHALDFAAQHNFQPNVHAIERVYLELQERKQKMRKIVPGA